MTLMSLFNRIMMACNPANISFFLKTDKEFRKDASYSILNLMKSLWLVSKDEKVIKHGSKFIYSSFLPAIPSRAAYQVLFGAKGEGSLFEDHTNARRKAPISMYLAITNECGYNCSHCSAADRTAQNDLSTDEMIALVKDIQDMGTAIIGITGGEPMLRRDLKEIVRAIDDRSQIILFSSGVGMTREKMGELKEAGLFAVGISLDSSNPSEMDNKRGVPGAFATALKAIKICREVGIYTMAQVVANRQNMKSGELLKTIECAASSGAQEVRVLETLPAGKLIKMDHTSILTQDERNQLRQMHIDLNKKRGYPKVSVFAHTENFNLFGCGAGTQHSYIDAAGNLYPCDFVPLSFGNVREHSIASLWSDMHAYIRTPRDTCMILELSQLLKNETELTLPMKPEQSEKMISRLKRMESLPGFYATLKGSC